MYPPKIFSYRKDKEIRVNEILPIEFKEVSNRNLIRLMLGIEVNLQMVEMYNFHIVKIVLREKLRKTGLPFFSQIEFENEIKKFKDFELLNVEKIVFSNDQEHTEDNNNNNDDDDNETEIKLKFKCKICLDQMVKVCFLPCRHMVSCTSCTLGQMDNLSNSNLTCPLCRSITSKYIRVNDYNDDQEGKEKKNYFTINTNNNKRTRKLQQQQPLTQQNCQNIYCKICEQKFVNIILLPCSHMSVCSSCYSECVEINKQCPQCERAVDKKIIPILV